MSKIGRAKLDKAAARSARLIVRFTEAERLALLERSTAAGFATVSDFVRAVTLHRPAAIPPPVNGQGVFSVDDRRALVNLGNNLNQVARSIHQGAAIGHDTAMQLAQVMADLDAIFDRYLPQ